MVVKENWDLDIIFEGGSQSSVLSAFLADVKADIQALETDGLPAALTDETVTEWVGWISHSIEISARLREAGAFTHCLRAQDVSDEGALQLEATVSQLGTQLSTLWNDFAAFCAVQPDDVWEKLIKDTDLAPIAFGLNENRDLAAQKMDPTLERLANELMHDGYHAWGRLYTIISGDRQVTFRDKPMSLGQLQSLYIDNPDRATRQEAFELFEENWGDLAKTCALALNNQAGFRLTMYKHRDWQSVLKEPLFRNRLSAESLEAMWATIDAKSAKLLDYFSAKAKVFGIDQLSWYDVGAPVGEITQSFSYNEAADFVIDNIRPLNPNIADFCHKAISDLWIEAEDRPGKQAGGFCTTFPLQKQSRIFMTYNGSYNGLLTLAHELGHAYHNWVMRDLPFGARHYVMSTAETASTFNELIVTNAGLDTAASPQERLSILGSKLNDAAAFLMNIRARFDFETAFFDQRRQGQLSVDELNELMVTAQKGAYKEGLAQYHPWFWASKLHFYITQAPFYNFPYTFGYLFSHGLYAQALAEGADFQEKYIALLRDTGSMNTEDLAKTHLGVDLTKPEFWETAVDQVLGDVDPFVALVEELY